MFLADPSSEKRAFIRTTPRIPGERISLTNIVKNDETTKMLKFAVRKLQPKHYQRFKNCVLYVLEEALKVGVWRYSAST